MRSALLVMLGAVALADSGPALTHHSTANFDFTKSETISGTVEYFSFTNPHSFIDLKVDQPDDVQKAYKIFTVARVVMTRSGWGLEDLKAGDKVTITGNPDRKTPEYLYLTKITFASGKVWDRDPALQR